MSLAAGSRLGTYEILAPLGSGGMGEVYRAQDLRLGREVALKLVRHSLVGDPASVQRFEEEARCASVLNHPNIVTIYGVGDHGDVSYIAMELVQGEALNVLVARGPMRPGPALDIAVQIADAVAVAHEHGIVHRDLKPGNVMVTPDGLVKVLDFGLAKRDSGAIPAAAPAADLETRLMLTQPGMIVGSIGYMSPEQASGRPAGFASDQFALGAILYEMLCGRRAFVRDTALEELIAIVRDPPEPLRTLDLGIPPALERVVGRCLAKEPAARYERTRQLAEELRAIRNALGTARDRQTTAEKTPARIRFTRRAALWLAGSAAVGAGAVTAGWRWLPGAAPPRRSLAVLPFVNVLNEDAVDYLCDGLTEGVIRQLSRLPSLALAPRTAVFNFKGKKIDARTAGATLHVDTVLTGTLQRQAGRVLVAVELMNVSGGETIWRNKYDSAGAELLTVQDEIAGGLVDQGLGVRLTEEERRKLARVPTTSAEAYDLFMQARHVQRLASEDAYLECRRLLRRAIVLDPKFALAYATLAGVYAMLVVDGLERPTDTWPQVHRYNQQALEIDPGLRETDVLGGAEAFFFDWNWARAEQERKQLTLGRADFDPGGVRAFALQLWALGQVDEAVRLARRMRESDPVSPLFVTLEADYLAQAGQLDAAVTTYRRAADMDPGDPNILFGMAEALARLRRYDEALDARRRAHALRGDDSLKDLLASARGEAGYRKVERAWIGVQLLELQAREAGGGYTSPLDFARVYAQLGDREQAFKYLEAAFEERSPGLVFLKVDRVWDGVRGDSRFKAAVERIALP